MRTITIFNIDFIQRIITPDEINPRVDGSSFIPPLNELPTSQLLTFLQTPITNHFSEKFQNYFLHFMLRSPGLLLMIWVVWSGAPQPFVGACCIELHRNRWHCPNPSAVTIWIFTAAKSSNLGRLTFWSLTTYIYIYLYTECHRRNGPNFGRVFLMLNYTGITQNTYIQSWTVTEIMASEVWNFDSCYTLIDYQIHNKTGRNMWFL